MKTNRCSSETRESRTEDVDTTLTETSGKRNGSQPRIVGVVSTVEKERTTANAAENTEYRKSGGTPIRAATAVDVIDAAGGNVGSLCRALERLGVDYQRVNGATLPKGERPIILPGVGAFGAVMNRLTESKLDTRIKELVSDGVPFLGICVGLQVLFESSEESPGVAGLSLLPGNVKKFTQGKVPQIGWNYVNSRSSSWSSGFAYFVNSYYAAPEQPDVVLYQSEYFQSFCAAVEKDNITAFQFHPEKSGAFGTTLLERWLDYAGS